MKKKTILIIAMASSAFLLLLFAPWITNATQSAVVEKLGETEARYIYLGEGMALKDIPKQVSLFPFGRFVAFPGEAGWIVAFYETVIF